MRPQRELHHGGDGPPVLISVQRIAALVSAVPFWLPLHFFAFIRVVQSLDSSGCNRVVFKLDCKVCQSTLDYRDRKVLFPVRQFTCKFIS